MALGWISSMINGIRNIFVPTPSSSSAAGEKPVGHPHRRQTKRTTWFEKHQHRETQPQTICISTDFSYVYSPEFKRDVAGMSENIRKSADVMPSTLSPSYSSQMFSVSERTDLSSITPMFVPIQTPNLTTTLGIARARKKYILDHLAEYNRTLSEVASAIRRHSFDEAECINDTLISSIENKEEFAECLKAALGNITMIAAARDQFRKEEAERKLREEQERLRREREIQRRKEKSVLLSKIAEICKYTDENNFRKAIAIKTVLLPDVQVFSDAEVNKAYTEAANAMESKYKAYRDELERIAREAEEKRIAEEKEKARLEQIRLRDEKRERLKEQINELQAMMLAGNWPIANDLKEDLMDTIPAFGDESISEEFKIVVIGFDDKFAAFRAEQEKVRKEQQRLAEIKRKQAEVERAAKRLAEVNAAVDRLESAVNSKNWAVCEQLIQTLPSELDSVDDATIEERYARAKAKYDAVYQLVEKSRKEREEAEAQAKREEERLLEEQRERRIAEERQRRLRDIKSRYIIIPSSIGDCICLTKYYPQRYQNVSDEDERERETVYNFKDKYNNKPFFLVNAARITICNELSSLLRDLYGDELYHMWFCTAQASTPESADRRFKDFCQMMENACGIKNGYHLIKVIGEKESASSGNGQRGDISNLQVSNDVRGKDIVLFDDITTSGGTLNNLGHLLLHNGAKSVQCIAYGKTQK